MLPPGWVGSGGICVAGLVVRFERTGRPACLDFLGLLIEICDVIACSRKCWRVVGGDRVGRQVKRGSMSAGQLWAGVDVGKDPSLQSGATEGVLQTGTTAAATTPRAIVMMSPPLTRVVSVRGRAMNCVSQRLRGDTADFAGRLIGSPPPIARPRC